jgi:hypothetical protein
MIDKLPPGDWHFAGGYNAVQVGDIKKIRKENDMTEKKTASVRKELDQLEKDTLNKPHWSPLSAPDVDIPRTQLICGACGKPATHTTSGQDVVFIHKCDVDREYLETMKRIAFKALGIEDPDEYIKRMQGMMPQPQTQQMAGALGIPVFRKAKK